jgi:hypothetical protein
MNYFTNNFIFNFILTERKIKVSYLFELLLKLKKTHTCHFLLNFSINPKILPMFSFNFFLWKEVLFFYSKFFSKAGSYCVSVGLLPAKILCALDFCKLHKQEVSRNVDEISLPPDYYQRVLGL